MARLQILELPEVFLGEASETPFVLVVDQYEPPPYPADVNDPDPYDNVAEKIGARAVLVFEETVEIPANDIPGSVDEAFKSSVESWATGTNETIARLIDAINGKTKRPKSSPTPRPDSGALPPDAHYEMTIGGKPVDWTRVDEPRAETSKVRDKDAELRAANEWIERLATERNEARSWARHGYEIGQKHCGWSDHGVAPGWLTEGWPPHIDSCEHLKQAAECDEALTRVRAEVARIRTVTPTWGPVADLIDAALNGTRQPGERTAPDA